MSTLRLNAEAIRERQAILQGRYTCGDKDLVVGTQFRHFTIKASPFHYACSKRPLSEPALCELPDEVVGIDTMSEPKGQTGWQMELTVRAKRVIDDLLDFGEDD